MELVKVFLPLATLLSTAYAVNVLEVYGGSGHCQADPRGRAVTLEFSVDKGLNNHDASYLAVLSPKDFEELNSDYQNGGAKISDYSDKVVFQSWDPYKKRTGKAEVFLEEGKYVGILAQYHGVRSYKKITYSYEDLKQQKRFSVECTDDVVGQIESPRIAFASASGSAEVPFVVVLSNPPTETVHVRVHADDGDGVSSTVIVSRTKPRIHGSLTVRSAKGKVTLRGCVGASSDDCPFETVSVTIHRGENDARLETLRNTYNITEDCQLGLAASLLRLTPGLFDFLPDVERTVEDGTVTKEEMNEIQERFSDTQVALYDFKHVLDQSPECTEIQKPVFELVKDATIASADLYAGLSRIKDLISSEDLSAGLRRMKELTSSQTQKVPNASTALSLVSTSASTRSAFKHRGEKWEALKKWGFDIANLGLFVVGMYHYYSAVWVGGWNTTIQLGVLDKWLSFLGLGLMVAQNKLLLPVRKVIQYITVNVGLKCWKGSKSCCNSCSINLEAAKMITCAGLKSCCCCKCEHIGGDYLPVPPLLRRESSSVHSSPSETSQHTGEEEVVTFRLEVGAGDVIRDLARRFFAQMAVGVPASKMLHARMIQAAAYLCQKSSEPAEPYYIFPGVAFENPICFSDFEGLAEKLLDASRFYVVNHDEVTVLLPTQSAKVLENVEGSLVVELPGENGVLGEI